MDLELEKYEENQVKGSLTGISTVQVLNNIIIGIEKNEDLSPAVKRLLDSINININNQIMDIKNDYIVLAKQIVKDFDMPGFCNNAKSIRYSMADCSYYTYEVDADSFCGNSYLNDSLWIKQHQRISQAKKSELFGLLSATNNNIPQKKEEWQDFIKNMDDKNLVEVDKLLYNMVRDVIVPSEKRLNQDILYRHCSQNPIFKVGQVVLAPNADVKYSTRPVQGCIIKEIEIINDEVNLVLCHEELYGSDSKNQTITCSAAETWKINPLIEFCEPITKK